MDRDHSRSQPSTRTRALARALGQALVCSSVGTLSVNNKPVVAAPFADTFDCVNFGQHEHLDYPGAGRHGQGTSVPQLLGKQEAHCHDAGEGDTRTGAEQVQARGTLPERWGQRSQELVPLQKEKDRTIEIIQGDLLQQLAEARAMNEDLQAQLDMASGSFLEFERAEENLTLMETQIGDLDQTTQNYVRAMISEYRRLKLCEEETRHQSRTFASKQPD